MRLPSGYLLSKACADKNEREARPALAAAYVRVRDGKELIFASNGTIGVSVPLPEGTLAEDDRPGAIPVEALDSAEKHKTAEYTPELNLGESDVIVKAAPGETLIVHRNPDLGPDVEGVIRNVENHPEVACVGLDLGLLRRLARALGTEKIRLSIRETGVVVVTAWADSAREARGIIAPLKEG